MPTVQTMPKHPLCGLLLLLALLAVTGCVMPAPPTTAPGETLPSTETPATAGATTPPGDAVASLENVRWELVSWGSPGAETPVIEGSTVTLEFSASGEVGGSGGCNSYGGNYEVQENRLVFGEIVSTLIACADQAVTEQEMQYLAALQSAGRYEISNGMLTIWYGDESGVLHFSPAAVTTPLDSSPVLTPGATISTTGAITSSTSISSGG
jgi:heat shock protein HslJ